MPNSTKRQAASLMAVTAILAAATVLSGGDAIKLACLLSSSLLGLRFWKQRGTDSVLNAGRFASVVAGIVFGGIYFLAALMADWGGRWFERLPMALYLMVGAFVFYGLLGCVCGIMLSGIHRMLHDKSWAGRQCISRIGRHLH
jgi:hypothetical protein